MHTIKLLAKRPVLLLLSAALLILTLIARCQIHLNEVVEWPPKDFPIAQIDNSSSVDLTARNNFLYNRYYYFLHLAPNTDVEKFIDHQIGFSRGKKTLWKEIYRKHKNEEIILPYPLNIQDDFFTLEKDTILSLDLKSAIENYKKYLQR